jgi:hypothetical protein
MSSLISLLATVAAVLLLRQVVRRAPYFQRPDVVARRAAKAQLRRWVSLAELFFAVAALVALVMLFFPLETAAYGLLHPHAEFLPKVQPRLSSEFLAWLIQVFAPLAVALPLGLILANLISWLIPPIRKAEDKIMARGVPGYAFKDLNLGLLKFAAVSVPTAIVLAILSLMRL